MKFQTLLPSGLGLRYRELSPTEFDELLTSAAVAIGVDKTRDQMTTFMQLKATEKRLGVKRMILDVTKESGIEDLAAYKGGWRKLSAQDIDEKYDTLFGIKDHQAINRLYDNLHGLTEEELESVSKKALPVSED